MNKSEKNKFRLPISAYISYLLLASVLLTGVTLSKYTTKTASIDEARVAIFKVGMSSSNSSIELEAGETTTQTYTVKNDSEVAIEYTLIPTAPSGIIVTYADGSALSTPKIIAAQSSATVSIKFDASGATETINGNISLDVYAEQIN